MNTNGGKWIDNNWIIKIKKEIRVNTKTPKDSKAPANTKTPTNNKPTIRPTRKATVPLKKFP